MTMECDPQTDAGRELDELAAELHRLLEGQLAAGREGDLSRLEQLGASANAVVAGIVRQGGDVPAVLGARRRELERAYGELTLVLRAQQAEVQGKLKQVRQVKRAVGVYRVDH